MKITTIILLLSCMAFFIDSQKVEPQKRSGKSNPFESHFRTLIQSLTDQYGRDQTPVWLSSWNLATNEYPFDFSRPDSIPCRVYLNRSIDAPRGATLYWDLPDIAAAVALSEQTGDLAFEAAAGNYVRSYLERNTAKNGIILWGNHYYYDVVRDTTVKFQGSEPPEPVDYEQENGDLHEMRPILPPWKLLFAWFPDRIEKHLREALHRHIVDRETGEFNRHANQKSEYAFIEAGSILIHAAAFLYAQTQDPTHLELANTILRYSFSNRNLRTGLVINSPSRDRWDQHASTTEIGLWALNILKAREYLPDSTGKRWIQLVENSIAPWLEHGFDKEKDSFYGALQVADAKPIEKKDNYPYKPGTFTDIWNPLFPTHDYPLPFAECCLLLYEITSKPIYKQASQNWLRTIKNQLDESTSTLRYAENYARIIYFLQHYGTTFNDRWAKKQARRLTKQALSDLYVESNQLFRSHTGEMRYDCVDGIGLLFFAVNWVETGNRHPLSRTFF